MNKGLNKDGVVLTSKFLWTLIAVGFVLGLVGALTGFPFWPTLIVLMVAAFVTTYIWAENRKSN